MIPLPSPWLLLAAVLAIGGAYVAGKVEGDGEGSARVQQAWDRAEKLAGDLRAKRIEARRRDEQALQLLANIERNQSDEEKKRLAAGLDRALRELRNRPARPDGLQPGVVPAGTAGAASEVRGCTGAELYRDDAEFLTRKSHIAQLIRADRDTCYRLYEAAREKLKAAGAP